MRSSSSIRANHTGCVKRSISSIGSTGSSRGTTGILRRAPRPPGRSPDWIEPNRSLQVRQLLQHRPRLRVLGQQRSAVEAHVLGGAPLPPPHPPPAHLLSPP